MILLFLWALVCLVADRATTIYAIEHLGAKERNPVVRWVAEDLGWIPASVLSGMAYLGIILYLVDNGLTLPVYIILGGYTLVCAWDAAQIAKAKLGMSILALIFGRRHRQ